MLDREIACIIDSRYVPKVGKYIVKLGFVGEKAKDVWMTGKQYYQLERLFAGTQNGHSTQRLGVIGVWNDKGYYAWSRLEKTTFIEPEQYPLNDLRDDDGTAD